MLKAPLLSLSALLIFSGTLAQAEEKETETTCRVIVQLFDREGVRRVSEILEAPKKITHSRAGNDYYCKILKSCHLKAIYERAGREAVGEIVRITKDGVESTVENKLLCKAKLET